MYLTGTEGDDILIGTAEADTILGLGGNDSVQGGDGDDLLIGGAGNDTLDGGAGSDTVSYVDADPVGMFSFLMINLSGQYVSIIGPGGAPVDTLVSIENAIGSAGADWLIGTSGDNHLVGGAGNDMLDGKGGADVLDGGDGNDNLVTGGIFGAAAPGSLMIGGDGVDTIQSGNSNDTMLGGAGDDFLEVSNYATNRVLDGGDGADTLIFTYNVSAFPTGVFVDLNKAVNTITPGVNLTITNVENITGTVASDTLIGDANANLLRGEAGNDWLYGRDGNDSLQGGDGDDYLEGGRGQDTLNGGAGADTFFFVDGDATSSDTIVAFGIDDHIAFAASPAGSSATYAELETLDFAAVSALFAGEGVRYVATQAGNDVFLFADLGEEGTSFDNLIVLTGTSLSAIDAGSILGF
jgi:Ca2+-binding RTX toxin-like protein